MISIIIPTFNRAQILKNTLESIVALKADSTDFEVVVIDNGSVDETAAIVREFQAVHSNFYYFYDAIPGLLTGRHRGAEEAKGEILAFIDDDVELSASWLETIREVMQAREDVDLLTGPALPRYESVPPSWLDYFWTWDENGKHCGWLSLMDFGDEEKEIDPVFVWGLNFTIRRSCFDRLKGFHPDNMPPEYQLFQGDGETGLSIKAKRMTCKAWYHPGVKLHHVVPESRLTEAYFEKRAFYQGVANSFTWLKNDENGKLKKGNSWMSLARKISRKIRKKNSANKQNNLPLEIIALQERLVRKEREGFQFHQELFASNEKVKNWVLKTDYLDYKLPVNDRKSYS